MRMSLSSWATLAAIVGTAIAGVESSAAYPAGARRRPPKERPRREPYPSEPNRVHGLSARGMYVDDLADMPDNPVITTSPLYDPREVHAANAAARRAERKQRAKRKKKR
jgi:hypothetical protein